MRQQVGRQRTKTDPRSLVAADDTLEARSLSTEEVPDGTVLATWRRR